MPETVAAPPPPALAAKLLRQFGRPTGPLGRVAGRMMASRNDPLNQLVVERLEVEPGDRFLDVGCGPGLALVHAAARVGSSGSVFGVDVSDVMVRAARRRNRHAIDAGRVDVRWASAGDLPFTDGQFTKASAVNSMSFWPSPATGLRELRRVLASGGRIAIALRMRQDGAGRLDRSAYGLTEERLEDIAALAWDVGFVGVDTEVVDVAGESIALVLASGAGRTIERAGT